MSRTRVADRYTLDREIGRGGTAAVWVARDEVLGRDVALKRIGLPPGSSAYELSRAEREARLAARVNHHNVVAVFDFVHDGDEQWLVMEYVDGTTLARMIRERGPLSPDEAAPILLQVAEALAAAHRMGVVHRDVKPSNILIGRDGTVKLSDFGIARGTSDASLTQTGVVTGSPAYLAPEVATGSSATTASDVWSFGTTVFHTLAGTPPYDVSSDSAVVLAVLYRIANEPPPQLDDAGWLGPLLEATMQRDPALRPSMDDVAGYLREGPHAPPVISTQVMPAVTRSLPAVTPAGPPLPNPTLVTPARAAAPAPAPARPPARPGAGRTVLAGIGLLAVLAAVGIVLLLAGGGQEEPGDAATGTRAARSAGPTGRTSDAPTGAPAPDASDLEAFATTYVETAADDPAAGFAMLTPDYQGRSPDYADFWGSVKKPEILDMSADPAGLTVTYTYRYQQKKVGTREETVTLQLVQDGGRLLIDDAVSSG